ncbi:MAG TPA: UDP-N-acetylmuramoyl-L-alanine--D-glutamate ligase [Terriglobales bacterium]|nr:UDP-N-acetylmuramoyl-L-alanine--D-glutamate ligase [Terriglobales bacterium]
MDIQGKKVLVLGLARSGRESARFLANQGAQVLVSDVRSARELKPEMAQLESLPIQYRLGGEDRQWLDGVDLVVTSPGVPATNPLLREAGARGIKIWSEVELAWHFLGVSLIAVTGTNGKSTTTTLVGEIFRKSGARVFVGGNLGSPLVGFVADEWTWGVVEISSFQLEWVESFRPRIAVLLNLTEDHLDRYPNFAAYCRTKERLFAAQEEADIAILNRDDPLVWDMRERVRARIVSIGFGEVGQGVFATNREIVWREASTEEKFPLERVKIQGIHNVENMMAAIAAAKAAGIHRSIIQEVLEAFPGLEHRLEFVREKNGVRYYDDSKGTNVGAVLKSLSSFSAPVILLAGGVDKGGDYGILANAIRKKVRRLVLFGAARELMAQALGHLTETVIVNNLENAVSDASAHARPGEVVLLSPACSSFDMFRDYGERGRVFKRLVNSL